MENLQAWLSTWLDPRVVGEVVVAALPDIEKRLQK